MGSCVWSPRPLRGCSGEQGCPVGYSVSQVQEERTKEEDRALACSPVPITAERRRSLWYATHYPTDERKVSRKERGFSFILLLFIILLNSGHVKSTCKPRLLSLQEQFDDEVLEPNICSEKGTQCFKRKPQAPSDPAFYSSVLPPEVS